MKFSERIIQIRKENNLTQDEMASRLFVTRQAISKWERGIGFPSLDVLRLISKEFNIGLSDLLDAHEKEKSKEYKAIGFKYTGLLFIYLSMFVLMVIVIVMFNYLSIQSKTDRTQVILYNLLLAAITLLIGYLLLRCIIPFSTVLVEYNDFGLRIKTLGGTKVIPFERMTSIEIRTHGNWTVGRLIIRAYNKSFVVFPVRDLNYVKTVIDEVKVINKD